MNFGEPDTKNATEAAAPDVVYGGTIYHDPVDSDLVDSKKTIDVKPSLASLTKNRLSDDWERGQDADGFAAEHESDLDKMVNSIVPKTDDPSEAAFSFRTFVLGTIWCIFLAAANALFAFRTNAFSITGTLATLLAFPMGRALEKFLPSKDITIPLPYIGGTFNTNPGRFNMKEHCLISIIAAAGAAGAYGLDNVVVQKSSLFMGHTSINIGQSLMWILASQCIGFGLAGVLRRFVIWPKDMVWPTNLSSIALFVSFHTDANEDEEERDRDGNIRWKMSRMKFFWVSFGVIFVYTWLPEFFATALQMISVLCLFAGHNKTMSFLASGDNNGGLGLGVLTFDWNLLSVYTPLTTPWWAMVNSQVGYIIWSWVFTPMMFYINAFGMDQQLIGSVDAQNNTLPVLNSVGIYNRHGEEITALSLYDPVTFQLNQAAYDEVGPIHITTLFALSYTAGFMTCAASATHVACWYGPDIVQQFKAMFAGTKNENQDIHSKLMSRYAEVPEWVYLIILGVMTGVMVLVALFTPFKMPIWAVLLAVGLAGSLLLPLAIIMAVSGFQLYLNVITEFVIGLAIPGHTVAVMAFKSLGTNTAVQALSLLAGLKLGHYMHIPPRAMLAAQLYGTILGAVVSTGTTFWVMEAFQNTLGKGDWRALSYKTFHSAGAIWGAIGPQRFFGIGSVYQGTLLGFLFGLILPVLPWLGNRYHPSPKWSLINIPLITSWSGPGGFQNYHIMPLVIGWFFQKHLFVKEHGWWKKYNYVLSIALDAGAGISVLVITLIGQAGIEGPKWALNPDTSEGVAFDYYCQGFSYDGK